VGGTCGTHGGGERCLQGFSLEDLGVSGRITLSWILGGYGPVAGFCEHNDEPSGSLKEGGYF
jgi:hypothetical protein